ncbi:hypothetical protein C2E20_3892 [Micractinium conductrix]|uniref:Uncharacterized protein n=1 Tax=Micractinium conductrix TaxID=554055 RepID=A0A2P6VFR0_9CHLO|nr:hypothetical protein C2E20_3892 [Micractinium conductrix]|eukprot:PSC72917.1 hypothetical protein C2E20_3892 [Micractinium conductrix]
MQLQRALVAPDAVARALHTPGGGGWRQRRQRRRAPSAPRAGLFDAIEDFINFEKWAPRSSQAWRLGTGNIPPEGRRLAEDSMSEEDEDVLNQRLADARRRQDGGAASAAAAAAAEEATPSFLQSTDEEVASALADRVSEVATAFRPGGSSADVEGDGRVEGGALSGPLLRELIETKWGKTYDLSFVRRDLPLGKTLICLNVMWMHLGQRSFPMTEEEYDEKMEMVALYLTSWGQGERVESFLRQPARPRMGMASKPIVGSAVSIQLDLDEGTIDEFFSQGGA